VNFTSPQFYGLILVLKTLRRHFLNINAASGVLAGYDALNDRPKSLLENVVAQFVLHASPVEVVLRAQST